MQGQELMNRADKAFTEDVVRAVLGDRYQEYYDRYKDGGLPVDRRLREEAQAHMLADILKGRQTEGVPSSHPTRNLLRRLWNWFISKFKGQSADDVNRAYTQAWDAMHNIATAMREDDFDTVLDRELIEKHEEMYALIDKTAKLMELAQEGQGRLAKKLSLLEKTQQKSDTKELRKKLESVSKAIDDGYYELACYQVLDSIGKDWKNLMAESAKFGYMHNTSTDLNVICAEASFVNRMSASLQGYIPYLKMIESLPQLIERGEVEVHSDKWVELLVNTAQEYLYGKNGLENLQKQIGQARFSVLKQLFALYYGDEGERPEGMPSWSKFESLDTILSQAKEDIKWWDTNMFSAGDSRNPLINTLHKIVVSQQAKRNNIIYKHIAKLQEARARLDRAGHDDKYVYEFDTNGIATGYYVGPYDYVRYQKDRNEFIASLEEQDLAPSEYGKALYEWEEAHSEEKEIEYGEPVTKDGHRRTERVPLASIYGNPDFQKGWSQEQKDYYKALLDMKADMDNLLPTNSQCLYMAPQVLKSVTQAFDKDGRGAIKTVLRKWKQDFTVIKDNTDYGNVAEVEMDFAGKEIKRVPLYYTRPMEDMRDLSTDSARAMANYICMAVNYSEMGKLQDAMRLLREHVVSDQYQVMRTNAGKPVVDAFKAAFAKWRRPASDYGEGTRTVKAIIEYIDRNFFDETKNVMGETAPVPFLSPMLGKDVSIDKDAAFNMFMRLTSVSRMGFNVLSGMTNIAQGETQMMIEANAGRWFDNKDLLWGKGEYGKLLPAYLDHFNSIDRHDRMYMLINQFNSSEDFFRDMRDKDYNKSALKRVLGRGNVYFMNTMGEHYLHTMGMLMILHHEKVIRASDPEKKEVSLYSVIEPVHDNNGWHLELTDDIEFVDKDRAFLQGIKNAKTTLKKSDRDQLFENLSVYINHINDGMHGGYSEAEKGNWNRTALGRAVFQFRQWMFGMYNKLYSKPYYDAIMNTTVEGVYHTPLRWLNSLWHDMKNVGLKASLEANKLSKSDKEQVAVMLSQAALYGALVLLTMLTAGWKDEDDRAKRLAAYNLRRLRLETGALSIVNPLEFVNNILTLAQSPMAGVKTLEYLTNMFDVTTAWQTIQSGRFKGWPKGLKALWVSTPFYNVQKLIDMDDYSYMFNIFNR
ncbi:MAG: hypothetical protein II661_08800 [Bacteroidales bacterium]|nr:hypothetical protein [Bacteroidales bacterium]